MKTHAKFAKILSVLLNFSCWGILIGSFLYGCVYLRGIFSTDTSGTVFISGISLDNLYFYSDTGGITVSREALRNMSIVALFVYFGQVPLMCWGLQILRRILHPMTQHRPFSGTGKLLTKLGWVSLAVFAVENLTDYAMQYIMENQYRFADFFLGGHITKVTYEFQPDTTFLLIAAVVFLLSGVFRYGEELQQLSDETL